MSSIDKAINLASFSHGFDDIGFAQTAGVINSVAKYNVGQYAKYALVTASAAHNLTKGQPVNITGTTDYDGPTRVLAVPSTTTFVIKRAFTVTKTGAWDIRAAVGNWDAFIPIGADITAANIAFEYHDPNQQGANEVSVDFTQNVMYQIPGGIKKCTITTAGNVRLIRAATEKPYFAKKSTSVPTIVAYNPASSSVGATIDILGTNFDPIPDRNSVTFSSGKKAKVLSCTEEILTVVVPAGAVTGVVTNVCNGNQTATGPSLTIS